VSEATVYSITHRSTGREYIGCTTQRVQLRWAYHRYASKKPLTEDDFNTQMLVVRALREHGAEAFDFGVLATLPTAEEGKEAERVAIAVRKPAFNACSGPTGDFPRTAETRARMSAANTLAWAEGRRSRMVSAETRAKMSVAKKGRPATAETRARLIEANRTRIVSDDARAKMSATRRGVKFGPMSEAHKAKIGASARARYAARKTQA
jgi:hypothetical protein